MAELDIEQLGVALQEHGDRTGTLCRLTRATAGVLGDIGADDDGAARLRLERKIAQALLERVDTTETRMLDLGHLAAATQRR